MRRVIDVTGVADSNAAAGGTRRLRAAGYLARAAWRRLARGDLRGIAERAGAQNYRAASLDATATRRALAAHVGRAARVALVFDHNMGGGANLYRRDVIGALVAAGKHVLLCTYNFPTLDYRVEHFAPASASAVRVAGNDADAGARQGLHATGDSRVYRASSFLALDALAVAFTVDEVFVNSPVSFDDPLPFAEWVAHLREASPSLRLTVAINDYFAVCPSFVLLNAER